MQSVVNNSQDARDLLIKAAGLEECQEASPFVATKANIKTNNASLSSRAEPLAYSKELLEVWEQSHYVRQGWLSAREVIQYLDLYGVLSHVSEPSADDITVSSPTSRIFLWPTRPTFRTMRIMESC